MTQSRIRFCSFLLLITLAGSISLGQGWGRDACSMDMDEVTNPNAQTFKKNGCCLYWQRLNVEEEKKIENEAGDLIGFVNSSQLRDIERLLENDKLEIDGIKKKYKNKTQSDLIIDENSCAKFHNSDIGLSKTKPKADKNMCGWTAALANLKSTMQSEQNIAKKTPGFNPELYKAARNVVKQQHYLAEGHKQYKARFGSDFDENSCGKK